MIRVRPRGDFLQFVAGVVQHLRHRLGTGGQGRTTQKQIADALAAPIGMILFEHENGALGRFGETTSRRRAPRPLQEPGRPLLIETLLPRIEGVFGDPDQSGKVSGRQTATPPSVQEKQSLRACQRRRPRLVGGHQPAPHARRSGSPQTPQGSRTGARLAVDIRGRRRGRQAGRWGCGGRNSARATPSLHSVRRTPDDNIKA
jgi:hypothetical protein